MITDIEEELKVKLLLRSTRQVALTESGQEYARQLEDILWRINELQDNITAISTAPQGLLRVHSRVMFGLGVLPPLVAAFRKLYPEIHIELTLTESPADLRRNQIDIDFRISPPVEAGVKRRMLFQSERSSWPPPGTSGRCRPGVATKASWHDCLAYQFPATSTPGCSSSRRHGAALEARISPSRHGMPATTASSCWNLPAWVKAWPCSTTIRCTRHRRGGWYG